MTNSTRSRQCTSGVLPETELVDRVAHRSFLKEFVDFGSPLTDVLKCLHLWIGIGTIVGVAGENTSHSSCGAKREHVLIS